MPQLDTNPWAPLFFMTWIIFLTQIPPKIKSRRHCPKPSPRLHLEAISNPWNWPW